MSGIVRKIFGICLVLTVTTAAAGQVLAANAEATTAKRIDSVIPVAIDELVAHLAYAETGADTPISLEDAVKMALENNHDLCSARISASAAVKGVEVAWRDLLPKVSLQAAGFWRVSNFQSNAPQLTNGNDLNRSLGIGVTQRLYDFGLSQDLIDVEVARFTIQQQAVNVAEQRLVTEVISAYYQFNLAVGQSQVRDNELVLAQELHRQAEIQFEVGTVPQLDVIRALARMEEARSSCTDAQSAVGNSAAYFHSLIGVKNQRYIPALLSAPLIEIGPEPLELNEAIAVALAGRPELMMQRGFINSGELAGKLSQNRPVLDAYAGAQYLVPATIGGTDNYEYGIRLSWPLYTGGKDKAAKEQAALEVQSLVEDIRNMEAQIELEVTTAWNEVVAARFRTNSAARRLELATEAHRAAAVGYTSGVTPYTDYINAMDLEIAAAIGYLTALSDIKLAQSTLARATAYSYGYPGDSRQDGNPTATVLDALGLAQLLTEKNLNPGEEGLTNEKTK